MMLIMHCPLGPLSRSGRDTTRQELHGGLGNTSNLISRYHVSLHPSTVQHPHHRVNGVRKASQSVEAISTAGKTQLEARKTPTEDEPPRPPCSTKGMPPRLNIPPITRIILSVLGVQSLLSFAIRYSQWTTNADVVVPYLQLVPQISLFYPWTFLTTTLVENNVFTLGIAGVTLFYGGRYLERAWTSREFAKFLLITALIPNVFTFGALVLLFAVTGDMLWTLTSVNGTIALQTSFLVAFSNLIPTHTVTLFRGIVSLRVPRFPLLHVLLITTLTIVNLLSSASLFLTFLGLITSYTYLRFYKLQLPDLDSSQTSTLRGDASESFAFSEFFPDPAKPVVASISNSVYDLLVAVRICSPWPAQDAGAQRERAVQRGTPGSARAEAERRRALALKALDQRLSAATAGGSRTPQSNAGANVQVQQPQTTGQEELGQTSYVPEKSNS